MATLKVTALIAMQS